MDKTDLRDRFRPVCWPLAGMAALLALQLVCSPGFFHLDLRDGHVYGSLVDIVHQGSRVILLSLGMTLVIASGGIDLSVGSIMAMAGALAAVLVTTTETPFVLVLGIPLGLGAAAGLWNGLLVARVGLQPIVATLILMVAGRGIAMLLTGGRIVTFEHPALVYLGNGHLFGLPFTFFLVTAALAATAAGLRWTALGLFLESVGDNERASRYSGVNTALVKTAVYVVSGAGAALAGLVSASNIKAADPSRAGEMMELDAIFAVVVGGTALTGGRFTLLGSLTGALLIQTLTITLYHLDVTSAVAPVPKAILVLAVCLLQSPKFRADLTGRFGNRVRA